MCMGTVYLLAIAIVTPAMICSRVYLYRCLEQHRSVVFEVLSVLASIVVEVSVGYVYTFGGPVLSLSHGPPCTLALTGHIVCWECDCLLVMVLVLQLVE